EPSGTAGGPARLAGPTGVKTRTHGTETFSPMSAMDEDLVGYLLDGLDAKERREVEALLEADPAARARLEALRQALEPLAADREDPLPPRGLAARTLARFAAGPCPELPRAPACGA